MDDAAPRFLPLAASQRGIRLRCLRGHAPAGPDAALLALCRGIEVGRRPLPVPLAAGAEIELPIARIPRIELPAELRFAETPEGPDLAPPWPLPNAAAALALLGPPAPPAIEGLRLEGGVLRGLATERANGLIEPVMYARINAAGARGVVTEKPWPLPEGGCAFRFSLPLEPGDLMESGLSVALHLVGLEAPVARFAWARSVPDDPAPRIAELEARVERLEGGAAAATATLAEAARRHAALLAERSDAFIETAAALLLDRLAGSGSVPGDGDDARLAALRRLIADAAAAPPPAEALLLGTRAEIPPAAGNFAVGWHGPEGDEGGAFRWMTDAALVVNPEPHRRVAGVTIGVRHLYGAEAPRLTGAFDGLPARVAVARGEDGHFSIRLEPEGGGAVPCQGLLLASDHAGVPLRDGRNPDQRMLSVAVSGVVFEFGPEPA